LGVQIKTEIKGVEEKIAGIGKRIEFQEFINRGVFIGNFPPFKGG